GRLDRPVAVAALARAATGRRGQSRSRPGAGDGGVSRRSIAAGGIQPRHAAHAADAAARRGDSLEPAERRRRPRPRHRVVRGGIVAGGPAPARARHGGRPARAERSLVAARRTGGAGGVALRGGPRRALSAPTATKGLALVGRFDYSAGGEGISLALRDRS